MITIVDYGVGNLFSLVCSFSAIGQETRVNGDPKAILNADKILLPGVGAFCEASEKLMSSGLGDAVREAAARGTPLLGICLGMQLLFERSFENGEYKGLGLINGNVRPVSEFVPEGFKVPHIGWNKLEIKKDSVLFGRIENGEYVYFVHSYFAADCGEYITATTDYGYPLTAAAEKGNVYGCQFHPEKSSRTGLNILRAFCEDI